MAVLDIDKILGKPKNRVRLIGLEMEGAWDKLPPGVRGLDVDRSVFRDNCPPDCMANLGHGNGCGEIPSGAIAPILLRRFVKRCYPKHVDSTCGLHIHMSFEHPRYYSVLMDQDYYDTMKEYLKRWAKKEGFDEKHFIWDRLAGKSIFCQDICWPDEQFAYDRKDYDKKRKGHRYTIVHWCGRLKTVEVRVLPMMGTFEKPDPEQAIRALRHVIDITNACIAVLAKRREQKTVAKAIINVDEVYKESFEGSIPVDHRLKLK